MLDKSPCTETKVKRFWIPRWVADHGLVGMGKECVTFMVLTRYANKKGIAWPSVRTIGYHIGANERTVRRHLRLLENRGLIKKITGGTGGMQGATQYKLFTQLYMEFQKMAEIEGEDKNDRGGRNDRGGKDDREREDKSGLKGGQNVSKGGTVLSAEVIEKKLNKITGGIGKITTDKKKTAAEQISELEAQRHRLEGAK